MTDKPLHFINQIITEDLATGKHQQINTRFPPEPNGYLHIGHAKSICLNFGIADEFKGHCFLRFDDTNPCKEDDEYVKAIIDDVEWLGYEWTAMTHASDYYQSLYEFAQVLIKKGLAYVDSLSMDDMAAYRGTLYQPGRNSPYRERSVAENLDLFQRMKAGEFADGVHVLRARIDMQSGNLCMRDPVLYRIRHVAHQRTGNDWCIYPMYDFAHPLSDALEHITHSLCTLEFQDHRPLYDWLIEHCDVSVKPVQIEFARLNLSHTITSKRKLRELVESKVVDGWDDPRLPTLRGMRKRGYPAAAIRQFCDDIGISKSDSVIDMSQLEACVRDVLNTTSKRALCVLDPIKVIIDNYPADRLESLTVSFNPNQDDAELREMPFSNELYIERSDFMLEPSKGYFRLAPGTEVRLRHAYIIRCNHVTFGEQGQIKTIHCTYDPDTLGKNPTDRKVKGVIHWVSAAQAVPVSLYQYDRLFHEANPAKDEDFMQHLNHNSLETLTGFCEPALASRQLNEVFQFERLGYYCVNQVQDEQVVAFHRVVNLKDTWTKV